MILVLIVGNLSPNQKIKHRDLQDEDQAGGHHQLRVRMVEMGRETVHFRFQTAQVRYESSGTSTTTHDEIQTKGQIDLGGIQVIDMIDTAIADRIAMVEGLEA